VNVIPLSFPADAIETFPETDSVATTFSTSGGICETNWLVVAANDPLSVTLVADAGDWLNAIELALRAA
jgi:hypothetical protein